MNRLHIAVAAGTPSRRTAIAILAINTFACSSNATRVDSAVDAPNDVASHHSDRAADSRKHAVADLVDLRPIDKVRSNLPTTDWVTVAGGEQLDHPYGIASDAAGNSYVVGAFQKTAFFGPFALTSSAGLDAFVAKIDAAGKFVWAKSAGGGGEDVASAVAVDLQGNVFIVGGFSGEASFGSIKLVSPSGARPFLAKLDPSGAFIWARTYVADNAGARGVGLHSNGDLAISGTFGTAASLGPTLLSGKGLRDVFAARLDATGDPIWAVSGGGIGLDELMSSALDTGGDLCLVGHFSQTATFGSTDLTSAGDMDVFIARVAGTGKIMWAVSGGSPKQDNAFGAGADNVSCFIAGFYEAPATFGGIQLSNVGHDAFAAKAKAGQFEWAAAATGAWINGEGIAADLNGGAYFVGHFNSLTTFGTQKLVPSGKGDAFVAHLDSDGHWVWLTSAGGTDITAAATVTLSPNASVVVGGGFHETTSFHSIKHTSHGDSDVFVWKLTEAPK